MQEVGGQHFLFFLFRSRTIFEKKSKKIRKNKNIRIKRVFCFFVYLFFRKNKNTKKHLKNAFFLFLVFV